MEAKETEKPCEKCGFRELEAGARMKCVAGEQDKEQCAIVKGKAPKARKPKENCRHCHGRGYEGIRDNGTLVRCRCTVIFERVNIFEKDGKRAEEKAEAEKEN